MKSTCGLLINQPLLFPEHLLENLEQFSGCEGLGQGAAQGEFNRFFEQDPRIGMSGAGWFGGTPT